MAYAIRGAPKGLDVPEFLTQGHDFRGRYLPGLLAELSGALSKAPQVALYVGLEGILVSEQQFKEVRQLAPTALIRGLKLPLTAPTFSAASEIVQGLVQRVRQELPPQYVGEAEQAIASKAPRYAANVQEAAKALGISLPQATA